MKGLTRASLVLAAISTALSSAMIVLSILTLKKNKNCKEV